MANDRKTLAAKLAAAETLGFELVEIVKMTGTHRKLYFRYGEETFFITTSSTKSSDQRAMLNFRNDLRLIKRAIDTGDVALRTKYLGHER